MNIFCLCLWRCKCHSYALWCDRCCFQCSFCNRKYFVISANLWPKYGTNTETQMWERKDSIYMRINMNTKANNAFQPKPSLCHPRIKHVRSVYSIWLRLVPTLFHLYIYRKHIELVVTKTSNKLFRNNFRNYNTRILLMTIVYMRLKSKVMNLVRIS